MSQTQRKVADQIRFRPAVPADFAFCYKSMLNSIYFGGDAKRSEELRDFYTGYTRHVDVALRRGATLTVACPLDCDDTILGFVLTEGEVVHYAYVKLPFRQLGIASALLEHAGIAPGFRYTHETKDCLKALKGRGRYEPGKFQEARD